MVRKDSASSRKQLRLSLYKKQKGLCKICREPFEAIYLTVIDHKKPLALEGSDNYKNLQLLCIQCNYDKTRQDMIDIWKFKKKNMRLHKEKHEKGVKEK